MPLLTIHTNVSKEKVSQQLLLHLTEVLANMVGKPSSYCAVHVVPDQLMSFGGSCEPCAQLSLLCIGRISPEENKKYSAILAKELEALGVSSSRAFIYFNDVI